eukprot:TRINITY_DN5607_c0_g1_i2.p2 TRINITY_DN5607_c0_g1~~TRINITY_DN5607_c0_g1_i2.p2  ORF type:complete len:606 (+),score=118.20 TRINITY_DN5607_c0_g1_i2:37-1854(+)
MCIRDRHCWACMWLLVRISDGKKDVQILNVGEYNAGRDKKGDIVIDHKSVSRLHAKLAVTFDKNHLFSLTKQSQMTITDLSRFGTSINGTKISAANKKKPVPLKTGDALRFGILKERFTVEYRSTIFYWDPTDFTEEEKIQIREWLLLIGAHVSKDPAQCTHTLMKEATDNDYFYASLIHGLSIVSPLFIQSIIASSSVPAEKDFAPLVKDGVKALRDVDLFATSQNCEKRKLLFDGVTFVDMSTIQTIRKLLEQVGGKVLNGRDPATPLFTEELTKLNSQGKLKFLIRNRSDIAFLKQNVSESLGGVCVSGYAQVKAAIIHNTSEIKQKIMMPSTTKKLPTVKTPATTPKKTSKTVKAAKLTKKAATTAVTPTAKPAKKAAATTRAKPTANPTANPTAKRTTKPTTATVTKEKPTSSGSSKLPPEPRSTIFKAAVVSPDRVTSKPKPTPAPAPIKFSPNATSSTIPSRTKATAKPQMETKRTVCDSTSVHKMVVVDNPNVIIKSQTPPIKKNFKRFRKSTPCTPQRKKVRLEQYKEELTTEREEWLAAAREREAKEAKANKQIADELWALRTTASSRLSSHKRKRAASAGAAKGKRAKKRTRLL